MSFSFFKNKTNAKINPATEDTLAGIKSQMNLLTFDAGSTPANLEITIASIASGADIGIQNKANTSISPATQGTLASVLSQVAQFKFDSTNGLIASGLAPTLASAVSVKDSTSALVNPASDEALLLWRRMAKLMESKQTNDINRLKRVTIDSFGTDNITGVGPSTTVGVSGGTVPLVTIANDFSENLTGLFTSTSYLGWNDQMYQDVARNAYAQGIRSKLNFS